MSDSFDLEAMITRPHPEYPQHKRMTRAARAAQFMPFAALNGYEAAIARVQRKAAAHPVRFEDPTEE